MAEEHEFPPEELTCSICMKVLCQPHLVNCCEQQFCKECLDKWCWNNRTCPHCRSTDFSSIFMKQTCRKVGELKVYCSNKEHGCKAEIKICEFQSHAKRGCLYVEAYCPYRCKAKVFRGDLARHKETLGELCSLHLQGRVSICSGCSLFLSPAPWSVVP